MEQEVRRKIVRDEDVRPAVIVVIAHDDAKPFPGNSQDTGLTADVSECAVAVIVVEPVRETRVQLGAAVSPGLAVAARALGAEVDVIGHEQIKKSIVVKVCEGATGAQQSRADAGSLRDVGERSVPVVVVEAI